MSSARLNLLPGGILRTSLASAAFFAAAIAAAPSAHGSLIRYYQFENNLADSSASAQNGSSPGTVAFSATVPSTISGRSSAAASFSNTSANYASIPTVGFYNTAVSTGATISFWVEGAGTQTDLKVYAEGNSTSTSPAFTLGTGSPSGNAGKMRVYCRDNAGGVVFDLTSGSTVFDGAYHLVTLTASGGQLNLYVDGAVDSTIQNTPFSTSATQTVNNSIFGARVTTTTTAGFSGLVDDAAIYNNALTAPQVASLASGASPTTVPEPASLAMLAIGACAILKRTRQKHT